MFCAHPGAGYLMRVWQAKLEEYILLCCAAWRWTERCLGGEGVFQNCGGK